MSFAYAVTLPGSERLLKAELKRSAPELLPAFGRPGFITFKSERARTQIEASFAQASGVSLGAFDATLAREAAEEMRHGLFVFGPNLAHADAEAQRAGLIAELGLTPLLASELEGGDMVIDVILLEDGSRWLGWHPFDPGDRLHPGLFTPIALPASAPSRAFLKIEETLVLTGAQPKQGELVYEVGSAPGGAAYALLQRGLRVIGVDPGEMDARIRAMPGYRHDSRSINLIPDAELPTNADWLLVDMNVTPKQTLKVCSRVAARSKLKGAFLTIKLKDDRMGGRLSELRREIAALGFSRVLTRQLPSHRREVMLAALR